MRSSSRIGIRGRGLFQKTRKNSIPDTTPLPIRFLSYTRIPMCSGCSGSQSEGFETAFSVSKLFTFPVKTIHRILYNLPPDDQMPVSKLIFDAKKIQKPYNLTSKKNIFINPTPPKYIHFIP
jgi:hypothetical protein